MRTIERESDISEGIASLVRIEPRFARVCALTGHPPLRRVPGGFAALASIITEQMLSLHAANAIWSRALERIAPFEPEAVLDVDDATWREIGQSMAKARALRCLARTVLDGEIEFDSLETLDDESVHAALTALSGVGPWTAQIYMLTCMGRRDVWPAGDVALQTASALAFDLDQRPRGREMDALAEPWRPWRSVAARCLWAYYRHVRFDGNAK